MMHYFGADVLKRFLARADDPHPGKPHAAYRIVAHDTPKSTEILVLSRD